MSDMKQIVLLCGFKWFLLPLFCSHYRLRWLETFFEVNNQVSWPFVNLRYFIVLWDSSLFSPAYNFCVTICTQPSSYPRFVILHTGASVSAWTGAVLVWINISSVSKLVYTEFWKNPKKAGKKEKLSNTVCTLYHPVLSSIVSVPSISGGAGPVLPGTGSVPGVRSSSMQGYCKPCSFQTVPGDIANLAPSVVHSEIVLIFYRTFRSMFNAILTSMRCSKVGILIF